MADGLTPEARARLLIDRQLKQAGWVIRGRSQIDLLETATERVILFSDTPPLVFDLPYNTDNHDFINIGHFVYSEDLFSHSQWLPLTPRKLIPT